MVFYRTLKLAKSVEHVSHPFLASAYRIYYINLCVHPVLFLPLPIGYIKLCVNTQWQIDHTLLCGSLRRVLLLLACSL